MTVSVETRPYFFIFCGRYSVKLGRKICGIHVFLEQELENLWWYSLKPGDFWWNGRPYTRLGPRASAPASAPRFALRSGLRSGPRAQPGVRPPIPPETPSFNETSTGFKFLLQKTRETGNFRPRCSETVHKKKGAFPLKPRDFFYRFH